MNKGKAYSHRTGNRKGDAYPTPKSLLWVAKDFIKKEFSPTISILEPAAGEGALVDVLEDFGYLVLENDLYPLNSKMRCMDYLKETWQYTYVITNPPFSLWDEFVLKAKTHCRKFMFIGRMDYLSTYQRMINGKACKACPMFDGTYKCMKTGEPVTVTKQRCNKKIEYGLERKQSLLFKNLKWILQFNRYVDYQTPLRDDGLFHVGCQSTAWFIWDMNYTGSPRWESLDVQEYASLGQYNR
jgi:hypothetical protein